jgi:hypothetical protein
MTSDFMRGFDYGRSATPPTTSPYLVFADAVGFKAPTYKHLTRSAAEAEAKRLATLNPGVSYYVLGAVSITSATKPVAGTRSLV